MPPERKRKRSEERDTGVFVDIPQPSSSAMQAFHAAQHSQTGTQISLPASIFDGLGAPTAAAESHSEYVPSSHADSSVAVEAMRPLPAMDVRAFEPFLDDTTGMDLDRAGKVQQRVDSSPVESFSPAEVVKAQDVPRVGAWVLPELTEENANPRLPDYTSQEVLSQIPYPILDREEQEAQQAQQAQQAQHMVSQPSPERQRSSPPPVQSTPANQAVQSEPEMVLTQPIPDAPESTPALPPPTAVASQVDTSSGSSTSSLGWSALPRREVIELVHRSPHVPQHLKDEIERFITRASRTTSKPRHARASHSQSRSNDDSETQEDGVLRTKKVWCMDLLLLSPSSSQMVASELVQRLTQQTQHSSQSTRGGVAVILMLDTHECTFYVHELDESLAAVLRADRRYSVQFDAQGRRWDTTTAGVEDESEARSSALEQRLEALLQEVEALGEEKRVVERERDEVRGQHDFVRGLYDRASAAAASAQSALGETEARVGLLERQLTQGLKVHSAALEMQVSRWKGKVRRLEAQVQLYQAQDRRTDEGVRKKAALWDALQREEKQREKMRLDRIRAHDERKRQMGDGLGPFAPPQRTEPSEVANSKRIEAEGSGEEMDELAALALEAAQAGDTPTAGRSRRRRGLGASQPPPTASEVAAQVEAANLASATAREDSAQDVEDQFALFPTPSAPVWTQSLPSSHTEVEAAGEEVFPITQP